MIRYFTNYAAAMACLFALGGIAQADEVMDQTIDLAAPYMHHSCGSVLDIYAMTTPRWPRSYD